MRRVPGVGKLTKPPPFPQAGKNFVIAHPDWFTAGCFSHEGPTIEQMAHTSFEMTFYAEGHSGPFPEGGTYTDKPDKKVLPPFLGGASC